MHRPTCTWFAADKPFIKRRCYYAEARTGSPGKMAVKTERDRRTDGRTDGRTDRQTDKRQREPRPSPAAAGATAPLTTRIYAPARLYLTTALQCRVLTLCTEFGRSRLFAFAIGQLARNVAGIVFLNASHDQLNLVVIFNDTILATRT